MTVNPVARVADILTQEGYKSRDRLDIMSISFSFGAIFVAPEKFADLVVIVDTALHTDQQLQNHVLDLGRALDVSRSQRPLTSILVGIRPKPSTIEAISSASRVLIVGPITPDVTDDEIRGHLAVLLPISLPPRDRLLADSMEELTHEIGDLASDPVMVKLIEASQFGEKAVEDEIRNAIAQPLVWESDPQ